MPIEVDNPTIEAVLIPTRSTKPGVVKGKTPNPYTVEFKVTTNAATPDILVELELIPLVLELIFDSKLISLAPTSTFATFNSVPAFIEYTAEILPLVIAVQLSEHFVISISPNKSGGLNIILSASTSRHLISIWSVNCACFEIISLV